MRAMLVREYGTAPGLAEFPGPAGPAADVLAASLNPVDLTVSAGLNPFRQPELPLVAGIDGVARRPDGALVHFFAPAAPYGAFAERVPLAETETVPLPGGLDPARAAALGITGVATWTALAGTAALRPGESVLILGANGQIGRIAVQAARLLGARQVTAVVRHEAAREAPLRLGADTVVTSQDLPTLTQRLLEPDQAGYDVILDTLWGPVIPAAIDAAATGARVVHLGNSAGTLATLARPAIRKNRISILTYAIFTSPARERSDAFAWLAEHAAAGELTVEYSETGLEALPAVWGDFAAGRAQTKIIVTPNEATPPHDRPRAWCRAPSAAVCEPTHRKEATMTTTVSLSFAALTIDSADPAALADFWGKALGRPVSPGAVAGDTAIDATGPDSGPRMILHNPPGPGTATNRIHPVLVTDHHDEETERLTALGARPLNEIKVPPAALPPGVASVRQTTFADPEGNEFDLVTWQPE